MDQDRTKRNQRPWKDRELPRTFEEKAFRLGQEFTDWLDASVGKLKFSDEGERLVTRIVEVLVSVKAAECGLRARVEEMRQAASEVAARSTRDSDTLKSVESKMDELLLKLESYDELGLNDARYRAKVGALAAKLSGKGGKSKKR